MTDKEKIRAEVKKVKLIIQASKAQGAFAEGYISGQESVVEHLEKFIDSMQEEPVSKQKLSNVGRTVKNWKEPVSEDLEEACEQLAENARKHKAETSSPFFSPTDYKQGVMDGAKWKIVKLMKDATEVTVYIDAGGYPYIPQIELYDYDKDVTLAKEGDKYKVVLIKEE